jgi:hypothetical protein
MEYIIGTKTSLAISTLSNLGIAIQLQQRNEKIHLEHVIACIVTGLYLADLHAGLIHMYLDHYSGDNKILRRFHKDFINHHKNPTQILSIHLIARHSSISVENALCLLYNTTEYTSTRQMITQLSFLTGTMCVHNAHRLSHYVNHATKEEKCCVKYKMARMLQDCNIIINPDVHRKHHRTENSKYSLLNGWANPLLDYIRCNSI